MTTSNPKSWRALLALPLLFLGLQSAHAVPSFARQTGLACAACHVGGFGPQLTPQGREFKLGGYVDSASSDWQVPLSFMAVTSYSHVKKDLPASPGDGVANNDQFGLDEASLFYGGRIAGPVGAFIQATYDGLGHVFSLDNLDVRAAHTLQAGGKDLLLGVSVNNNPTVQDPWNTTPAWRYPFAGSPLGAEPAGTLLEGGLEMQVLGATAYALWDDTWYAEAGGYSSLAPNTLSSLGIPPGDTSKVKGTAPYARFGWQRSGDGKYLSLGVVGMEAKLYPGRDRTAPANRYTDYGVDGTWQYLGNRTDVYTLDASYIREKQKLNAEFAADEAARADHTLKSWRVATSWYHDQTWGASLGLFGVSGTRDDVLFAPGEFEGSRTGKPDTRGATLQVDWTPFGKQDSWLSPWANLRVGAQYTMYSKFNGAGSNYDGEGRRASANDTLFVFGWLSF